MIPRTLAAELPSIIRAGRVLVIVGPRRAGKTTLVQTHLASCSARWRFVTGEDMRISEILASRSLDDLRAFVDGLDLLAIDEAQYVPEIGEAMKLLVDHVPELAIIATGSASFDLVSKVGEPLTGRKVTRTLLPISQAELLAHGGRFETESRFEERLIHGSYPEVLTMADRRDRIEYLGELVGSYLLKDVLALERVRQPRQLLSLLRALAYQIGKDVSLSELAQVAGIDGKTVARYLDLLEKSFVIFSLGGFSRNLRKEISKSRRYYFVDNGVRNALIANFNDLELRDDHGALFENLVISERIKLTQQTRELKNVYFWRTYDQKEVDLVEECGGRLSGFDMKYAKSKSKRPRDFLEAYPGSTFEVVHRGNYLDFVT